MSTFLFADAPATTHHVSRRPGGTDVVVNDVNVIVRPDGPGRFAVSLHGRQHKLHAVAHGDAVYVQLKGRAWRLEQVDPTRAAAGGAAGGDGASLAPMPGVVVSLQAAVGQAVHRGDALLVIESMKLQMTISAERAGVLAELPLAVGQTFQRGAVLARLQAEEAQA